ncbi:multidrug transporter [Palaeococcus pacificus DY20341]|uniref:Multidrug transporter n=1 Tax=Palaeococcus pacificus DY20341 TaxID=1343739 RepID=A0A075LRD1_9EURY|nr:DHH family phosphoesterase [Palaeococcus pacificus]AIF68889.1 multidrug transporter [Palaeococcus pacificus DY20341]
MVVKECPECHGSGKIKTGEEECKVCEGWGYVPADFKLDKQLKGYRNLDYFGVDDEVDEIPCPECHGKGTVPVYSDCPTCGGTGRVLACDVCGKVKEAWEPGMETTWICPECERKFKIVYVLDNTCDYEDVEVGNAYKGIIDRVERFGVFVKLNKHVVGLVKRKDLLGGKEYKPGEEILVQALDVRPDRNEVDLIESALKRYREVLVKKELPLMDIGELSKDMAGRTVRFRGKVTQIQVTGGPTVFTISDGTGITWAAAFEAPGVRAYPKIEVGDIVEVIGKVSFHAGEIQIEVSDMIRLWGPEAAEVKRRIEEALNEKAKPEDVGFLVKSEVLEKLKPKIMEAAFMIRKAIYEGRPILLRHHADADGYTSGLALESAIIPLLKEVSPDPDAEWHLFKRRPSKAPFYELEDVLKDIIFAVEDSKKFGEELPLVVIVDNGGTTEDIPAYKRLKAYGVPIVVVDHHDPRDFIAEDKAAVDEYVNVHVNPHLVKRGYYELTAGMIATELARFIYPPVEDKIKHLPAIAGTGDRSDAPEFEQYKRIAKEAKGLDDDDLKKIAEVIDHEAYYWKFMDGKGIIEELLLLSGNLQRHRWLIDAIYPEVKAKQEKALKASLPHVKSVVLPNGIRFNTIDIELYAPKFEYPAPGKLSGLIHDHFKEKYGEESPILTLAYGPDFAVVRASDGMAQYNFDLNVIIPALQEKLPDAGIEGGGHSFAGSIKFFEGKRKEVLEEFAKQVVKLKRQ